MKKYITCLLSVLFLAGVLNACDMAALIFRQGVYFSDFSEVPTDGSFTDLNHPEDWLAFVMSRSNSSLNNDGYGLVYYPQEVLRLSSGHWWYKYVHSAAAANQVWYTGNYFNAGNSADTFDKALNTLRSCSAKASIVLCHTRNATANPFAPGNHPFRLDLNHRTYTLMHNGFISSPARSFMIGEVQAMDPFWFERNVPNYAGFPFADSPAAWIDSELLLHYLMCHIAAADYEVESGLKEALHKLKGELALSTNVVNFILSDGQRLFAFRSSPMTGTNSAYKLSCKYNSRGFWGIRTGNPDASELQLKQHELAVIDNSGNLRRLPDFTAEPPAAVRLPFEIIYNNVSRYTGAGISPDLSGVRIAFNLDYQVKVSIKVYNQKGQLVKSLTDGVLPRGSHTVYWDGSDRMGRKAAQGVYYIAAVKGSQRTVNRITYLRR
jgi:hypothetical protein